MKTMSNWLIAELLGGYFVIGFVIAVIEEAIMDDDDDLSILIIGFWPLMLIVGLFLGLLCLLIKSGLFFAKYLRNKFMEGEE